MLAADAADWATDGLSRQIDVIAGHIRVHEQLLASLPSDERAVIQDASTTLRKARQSIPVAFGHRHQGPGRG